MKTTYDSERQADAEVVNDELTAEMVRAGAIRLADLIEAGADLAFSAEEVYRAMQSSRENYRACSSRLQPLPRHVLGLPTN